MPNLSLSPIRYPVEVRWGEHTESCATPADLHTRLVLLWQMRHGLPLLTDADGRTLDARALMREALTGFYGPGFDGRV